MLGAFDLALAGGKVADIRIAFGGMAATPRRAKRCEAALIGRPWTRAIVERGRAALAEDFTPITDMRASKEYRAAVAGNLLLKFWLETTDATVATRLVGERRRAHG